LPDAEPPPELKKATPDQIRNALRVVYKPYLPEAELAGTGPSGKNAIPQALTILKADGLTAIHQDILDIADEKEFKEARRPQGQRHNTGRKLDKPSGN
jgi:hypothetical protein